MTEFAVVIPAAGESSRFQGFRQKKPFVHLHGVPVWKRTADLFLTRSDVSEVVLVLSRDDLPEFEREFLKETAGCGIILAEGGATRSQSVYNGICALTSDSSFIAIHDAARPLLTSTGISDVFAAAREKGAVLPGVEVTSTVKEIDSDGKICATIDRSQLRLAQTPQVFRRSELLDAWLKVPDPSVFTDEASLMEAAGYAVHICPGWASNIKITTKEDFEQAEFLLQGFSATSEKQGAESE